MVILMNAQDRMTSHMRGLPAGIVEFPYSPSIIPFCMRVTDLLMFTFSAVASYIFIIGGSENYISYYITCTVFVIFVYFIIAPRREIFSLSAIVKPLSYADGVVVAIITSFILFVSVAFGLSVWNAYNREWVMAFCATSVVAVVSSRVVGWRVLRYLSRRRVIGRSVVVLGAGEQSRRFLRRMRAANPYFLSVVGVFDSQRHAAAPDATLEGFPVLGDLDALLACARERKIDDVVVAMPWNADQQVMATVETLKELPINVYLSADLVGYELAFSPALGSFQELMMFEVVHRPISGWGAALKAIEDYVLASLMLFIISPLLLVIAIAIKLDTPGPVFFRQKRLGFNNKEFYIYKFRSMRHQQAPETVVRQASRGDPRVTRVGRFIRATSLDELPQLLNVLDGSMSLVGPRPHALSHNEEYGRRIRGYFARHRVKPGITGWAQVNGLRGETESLDKMEARIRHDIYYADNWSLFFDLRILVQTVVVAPLQKSAY